MWFCILVGQKIYISNWVHVEQKQFCVLCLNLMVFLVVLFSLLTFFTVLDWFYCSCLCCFLLYLSNNSIFIEERLERLTKNLGDLDLESPLGSPMGCDKDDTSEEESVLMEDRSHSTLNQTVETSQSSLGDSLPGRITDNVSHVEHQSLGREICTSKKDDIDEDISFDPDMEKSHTKTEAVVGSKISEACDALFADDFAANKPQAERRFPNAVMPLLRYQQYESSESSSRYLFDLFSFYPSDLFGSWVGHKI